MRDNNVGKKNTVQHQVNKIAIATRLYAVPKEKNPSEFDFSSIPPNNPDYSSTCSKKGKFSLM